MPSLENERGSVLVFATLIIVFLLIMVGIGLDTGQLTYVRSQGQAAVDAAALAAVSGLPSGNDPQVKNRAAAYNSTNDYVESPTNAIGPANVSYVKYDFDTHTITGYVSGIEPGVNGVRVALENATASSGITTPVFLTPLMRMLGLPAPVTQDINVSAVAVIEQRPVIPIALWSGVCPDENVTYHDVKIQMQHPDQKTGDENACWTTFLDCSSGAPDIKAGFEVAEKCSGREIDGQIDIGTAICQNRGQVNTVMQTAEDFYNATKDDLSSWLIPVIGGGGNCDPTNPTKITTWAKITPTKFVRTANPKYILADVICSKDFLHEDFSSSSCFSHRLVRETKVGM